MRSNTMGPDKTGSGKIMTKIVAVVAAVATLGSVVIAALYSA